MIGTSDFRKKFHALLYICDNSENSINARVLFKITSDFFHIRQRSYASNIRKSMLTDGSKALEAATEYEGYDHQRCSSHMIRNSHSATGKGHGTGTRGSLLKYLLSKHCSNEDIATVATFFLAIRHLPSDQEWPHLRKLLFDCANEKLFLDRSERYAVM